MVKDQKGNRKEKKSIPDTTYDTVTIDCITVV